MVQAWEVGMPQFWAPEPVQVAAGLSPTPLLQSCHEHIQKKDIHRLPSC